MKFVLLVAFSLLSTICFSQFYIGYSESDCRSMIYKADGYNTIITKSRKDDGGFFLQWGSTVMIGDNPMPYRNIISFNINNVSYTFWEIFENVLTFNYFVKRFNEQFTKSDDLEWNAFIKGKKYLIQGRYVKANDDYAIYYTELSN